MSREEAKAVLEKLVNRFKEQRDGYHDSDYNETKTRRDFIDPLFSALGWDMVNEQDVAEPYREVIHEDKVKIQGKTKAPDYGFRLQGSKQRLFFLEAKKPSVALKSNKESAFQIRRYGWNSKVSVSILTNFEEFIIYDCSKKPSATDSASVARLKYFTYEQFLQEFDFIYDTFSREAVVKGRFDKYVLSDTAKKGTQTPDKEFVASLNKWRQYIAIDIAKNNLKLNEDDINFAVQLIIDRLIFLRFCEDRGVETYGHLKTAVSKGDAYTNLFSVFKEADDKYNSGLFDFKKDQITQHLKVTNKVIKGIIEDLYYPKSEYDFKALPVEVLGNAYEQFLGKVIRINKAHHAVIEEKPDVRKAGGVYYTPQYIVDYIVEKTLGKLIKGKTPKEIEKIKIIDPACGSGSFLLGAFQYLLNFHSEYYHKNGFAGKSSKNNPLTPHGTLTTAEKKKILLNNIYGVDIDANAVEVTKLSLLLKCMEGETDASIKLQITMFHERVLPDLDSNIRDGNSLVDTDIYDNELDLGFEKKVKPFAWKKAFPEVYKQKGFDVVIGNPPYVAIDSIVQAERDYFTEKYPLIAKRLDLFGLFTDKGIKLLNDTGEFGFIIPMQFLRNSAFELLRKSIIDNNQIAEINYVGDKVFEQAKNDTIILLISKTKSKKKLSSLVVSNTNSSGIIETKRNNINQDTFLQNKEYTIDLSSSDTKKIFVKIESQKIKVKDHFNVIQGIVSGLNEAYIYKKDELPKIEKKLFKDFVFGSDFDRYSVRQVNHSIIYLNKFIDIKQFPLAESLLKPFKRQLDKRREVLKGVMPWYSLQWPRDPSSFENPKIIFQKIRNQRLAQRLVGTYDESGLYVGDGVIFINSIKGNKDELKFLLGVLNSSLYNYYFREQFLDINLKIKYLEEAAVVDFKKLNAVDEKDYKEIIKNVNLLLSLNEDLKKEKLPAKIDQIKNRISYSNDKVNELVYSLYKITADEISVIEEVK